MKTSGIIYYHAWDYQPASAGARRHAERRAIPRTHAPAASRPASFLLGLGLLAVAFGGITGPVTPEIRLEAKYAMLSLQRSLPGITESLMRPFTDTRDRLLALAGSGTPAPAAPEAPVRVTPAVFDPLKAPDGSTIEPVDRQFGLVIPKIGVNSAVIPAVNPTKPGDYAEALKRGVAHSSLSYFPNEKGTVYLFSHSTNYDWWVNDLNAVFYLLKNLEEGDLVVVFYKDTAYTYKITGKQVVKPTSVSYMAPIAGERKLILQTCWPPGSVAERLLIFADLVQEATVAI